MNFTWYIICACVAVIGAIDIVIAFWKGREYTISVTITNMSKDYPVIPFAFGLLCGHFFLTYGVC